MALLGLKFKTAKWKKKIHVALPNVWDKSITAVTAASVIYWNSSFYARLIY